MVADDTIYNQDLLPRHLVTEIKCSRLAWDYLIDAVGTTPCLPRMLAAKSPCGAWKVFSIHQELPPRPPSPAGPGPPRRGTPAASVLCYRCPKRAHFVAQCINHRDDAQIDSIPRVKCVWRRPFWCTCFLVSATPPILRCD